MKTLSTALVNYPPAKASGLSFGKEGASCGLAGEQ